MFNKDEITQLSNGTKSKMIKYWKNIENHNGCDIITKCKAMLEYYIETCLEPTMEEAQEIKKLYKYFKEDCKCCHLNIDGTPKNVKKNDIDMLFDDDSSNDDDTQELFELLYP